MTINPEDRFNAEERAFLERVAAFRQSSVEPYAARWEAGRSMPVEALREAAAQQLLAVQTPRDQGGLGYRYLVKLAMAEELARGDMAFAFSLVNTQNVTSRLAGGVCARHREEHVPALLRGDILGATALTEPHAGSDFSAIRMRAERVNGGWVLNGEKAWITNAAEATLFMTYAQTDPGAGWRGIGGFLIDARRPGFRRAEPYALLGGHAIGTGGFVLEDYFLPEEDALSAPGEGFKLALSLVNEARTYVAAMCAGMIASSLETALRYGAGREAFGRPIVHHQGLNWSLGDVANDLEALRGLFWHAGSVIDRGEDAVMAAAHAKKFAGRVTVPAVTACMQAMGAAGLRQDYPLGRHLACAKIAAYTDGSTEMMNERIGAGLRARFEES
ncbi:MAG: acyl-CoA dehydrogenase family protein [Ectothiorhodospiraceae bacterium]|nr:acyl-CoA dehydrogenase family protein [Ectothiorhodospiraceae bacterium]MCH8506314.1 acyl-CoA dehydrogenase family protein [Ectothiorhodospiraceae bacterium]